MAAAASFHWVLAALLYAHGASALGTTSLPPPPGYQDELLCPPGRCRQPLSLTSRKEQAKQRLKQECSAGLAGDDDGKPIGPRGLGEKLTPPVWAALTGAGWHNVTCLEVSHGRCPYFHGSAEWTVCQVASNFLLKTLGELNAGTEKTVPKVRGLLVPYLDARGGAEIPHDEKNKEQMRAQVHELWQQVDNRTATKYLDLDLDASILADELLKVLKQDGFGHLQVVKDTKGKPVQPGVTMQQVLFDVLSGSNWKHRFAVSGGGLSVYAWHLVIGLLVGLVVLLMAGITLWRSTTTKSPRPD